MATNDLASILKLDNGIQPYAWGSTTLLADFLGRPNPEARPQAELWIGSHPVLPSTVSLQGTTRRLDELIKDNPQSFLPAIAIRRYGPQLPFLLKVLAVAAPLSIQCHPSMEQAREGFARENAAGIPLDAPDRNYRDSNHKPELIMALTPYTALKGFRSPSESLPLLSKLETPELQSLLAYLEEPGGTGFRSFFAGLMGLSEAVRRRVAARAAETARAHAAEDLAWTWVVRLCELYPQDIGVLSPLYLNLVLLQPGEALYLPAGELHAYLDGLGVEIMANSDNVLRGGLTPKHVDVPELLGLLSFRAERPAILRPEPAADGADVYRAPADEFELAVVSVRGDNDGAARKVPAGHGVEVLLVLEGRMRVGEVDLDRGGAVLVPAAVGAYPISGRGRMVRARVRS